MQEAPPLNNQINSVIELYSSGNIKEALVSVEALINQKPNESLLRNIGGVCYRASGQLEIAVKCFERAVEIKPDFADAHYNLGLSFQDLNQLDAAVKCYKETLSIQSNYAKAHNNLGIIYRGLGQIENAVKSYEKALRIQPDYAEAQNNLGNTLNELGKFNDAIKSYETALSIEPNYFEVHNNLGNIFNELGQTDAALNSYNQALLINPEYADAHNNIGLIRHELGHLVEAVKCFEMAIAINPEHADAHNNLGVALNELGQTKEALNSYNQALLVNPDFEEVHFNLGKYFEAFGQTEKALNSYNQALLINPDYANAHNSLGDILRRLGQVDEAFNCFVHALAIEPDNAYWHRNLSLIKNYKNYTESDTQFIRMQSLLSSGGLKKEERIHMCFALAKAYKDLGRKDEFFKALNEGNQLRKEEFNYSIEKDLTKHSAHRQLFMSVIKKPSQYEPLTVSPIFIVGMPHSGTSLVEQIICSHDKVCGAGELSYINNLVRPIMKDCLSHNNALSEKNFFSIRQGYLNSLSSLNVSESIITDKMPTNFENIGFILNAFPEAKVIHLKRDAMAICWSIYQRYFASKGMGFAYNMEDLAQFYNSYTKMMDFWHERFPGKIYDICYEDMTTNQEEETRKLLEYCELDWDENCLNFHKNKRTVKTASSLQVREKMYQGSSEAWKKYEAHIQPLIDGLKPYLNQ